MKPGRLFTAGQTNTLTCFDDVDWKISVTSQTVSSFIRTKSPEKPNLKPWITSEVRAALHARTKDSGTVSEKRSWLAVT